MSAAEEYDGDDNGEVEQAESTAEFKPVVELPTDVQVTTGEEDDEVLFKEYVLARFLSPISDAYRCASSF